MKKIMVILILLIGFCSCYASYQKSYLGKTNQVVFWHTAEGVFTEITIDGSAYMVYGELPYRYGDGYKVWYCTQNKINYLKIEPLWNRMIVYAVIKDSSLLHDNTKEDE